MCNMSKSMRMSPPEYSLCKVGNSNNTESRVKNDLRSAWICPKEGKKRRKERRKEGQRKGKNTENGERTEKNEERRKTTNNEETTKNKAQTEKNEE